MMNGNRKLTLIQIPKPGASLVQTLLLILLLLAAPLAGLATTQDGGLPGDWLTSYRSARSIGFGGAFTAVADQPLGMLWNPAGMTQMDMNEIFAESTQLFEDTNI